MLAQRTFRPCQGTEHWPQIGGYCSSKMFLYGRGARERSEFYWLKASYFTLKFHPHRFITLVTRHDSSPFVKIKIARDLAPQKRVWLCVGTT